MGLKAGNSGVAEPAKSKSTGGSKKKTVATKRKAMDKTHDKNQ